MEIEKIGKAEKFAAIKSMAVDDVELEKINKYTISPLTADEVFAFKVVAGDNEDDDRNFEPFTAAALKDLAELYPGKPVVKDHSHSDIDAVVARIYDAEVLTDSTKEAGDGESFTQLILKAYTVRTAENAALIAEIKAGIKKEVSTAASVSSLICSICGQDQIEKWCEHYGGAKYAKDGVEETCLMRIGGCKEAYELSLVSIPAQPRAGVIKAAKEETEPEEKAPTEEIDKLKIELEMLDL